MHLIIKLLLSLLVLLISYFFGLYFFIFSIAFKINTYFSFIGAIGIIPSLFLPLIWFKHKKRITKFWFSFVLIYALCVLGNIGINKYNESITINTTPNINVHEYLPFDEDSKIYHLEHEASLKLKDNLPILDGAAAVFPVYSSFVDAVYPSDTELYDDVFLYNNTVTAYELLAQKDIDIFFGGYPSDEQIEYAKYHDTEFIYHPIASEAFVFFVHKDNPVENLSSDQIKAIYSGEITNWSEVGGRNEKIIAFQRNEGSGSQSMLKRFMGDTPIMEAPKEQVNDLMVGIIDKVSNYKNKTNSFGFSFRYYVEDLIKNPDIKVISVDGVYPNIDNISSQTYPITGYVYAVTYKDNPNPNVKLLIDWILSDEGQTIIEKTGYTPLK